MAYTAQQMQSAMLTAMVRSRHSGQPAHIIDQGGALEVVNTIAPSDRPVVTGIQAPRKTRAMIETVCEAGREIDKAMPYVLRACELVQTKHKGVEAEEVMADVLTHVDTLASWDSETQRCNRAARPLSFFTRLFGRIPY